MGKKIYIVDGTFSAVVEAESEEDAKVSFDPIDIDDYRILSVEEEEGNEQIRPRQRRVNSADNIYLRFCEVWI